MQRVVQLARAQRRDATPSEAKAWRILRDRRTLGFRFYRERPRHLLRADFYCAELRLIIEIDGGAHDAATQLEYDRERDRWFQARGIHTVRVRAEEVSLQRLQEIVMTRLEEVNEP